jgi:hypothetical protein
MVTLLLILHGLVGVALLGALTHQTVSMLRRRAAHGAAFLDRYGGVNAPTFTVTIVVAYIVQVALGGLVYPSYRIDVRIPFEEMALGWAIGLFELKEHFAGLGLALLPMYVLVWRPDSAATHRRERIAITLLLAFVVWWDFIVGHILNNLRGLA